MPRLLLLSICILFSVHFSLAQLNGMAKWFNPSHVDRNGEPIFHSVVVRDTTLQQCSILVNYYTIKDNINNPESSVFLAKSPSLDDYDRFATETPSFCFLVVVQGECKAMLMLVQDSPSGPFYFFVIRSRDMSTEKVRLQYRFPSPNLPILTMSRAHELAVAKVDPKIYGMRTKTGNTTVLFNGRAHNTLSLDRVFPDLIGLVLKKRLYE